MTLKEQLEIAQRKKEERDRIGRTVKERLEERGMYPEGIAALAGRIGKIAAEKHRHTLGWGPNTKQELVHEASGFYQPVNFYAGKQAMDCLDAAIEEVARDNMHSNSVPATLALVAAAPESAATPPIEQPAAPQKKEKRRSYPRLTDDDRQILKEAFKHAWVRGFNKIETRLYMLRMIIPSRPWVTEDFITRWAIDNNKLGLVLTFKGDRKRVDWDGPAAARKAKWDEAQEQPPSPPSDIEKQLTVREPAVARGGHRLDSEFVNRPSGVQVQVGHWSAYVPEACAEVLKTIVERWPR